MKKSVILLLSLGVALGSQALLAADGNDATLSFWEKLRKKIETLVPQKRISATTAVGGVRGAPISADDIYWKGEKAAAPTIDAEQLAEFENAMTLAESGDTKQAQAAFTEFIKKSPDSPLRKEADQALAQLNAMP